MNLKSLAGKVGSALMFALLAGSASANIVNCASGNLATVDYSTCDIGDLQFTFTGLNGEIGGGTTGFTPWSDSAFTFTVLPNGFELSGPPPQTVDSILNVNLGFEDYAYLRFQVTDLNGLITGVAISGGHLSVSGPPAFANDNVATNGLGLTNSTSEFSAQNFTYGVGAATPYYYASGPPIASAAGTAEPFYLEALGGDTASIDDTATFFTFVTEPPPPPPPVPEPRSLLLLSVGVLALVCAARGKLRS